MFKTLFSCLQVSYIKSMDIWMTACMGFLVLTLLEFALANSLARHQISTRRRKYAFQDKEGNFNFRKVVSNAVSLNVRHRKETQAGIQFTSTQRVTILKCKQKYMYKNCALNSFLRVYTHRAAAADWVLLKYIVTLENRFPPLFRSITMYSNGTQYAADAAALCGYSLKLINVFYFFPLILNTCNIPLQPKPVENKEVNGDTVSVPKQVTVESMDNIESVFLHHPRHHRCCLTCGLSRLNITAQKVDTFSRFAFPVLFAIFNLTYWSVYMHKRREGYLAKE